MQTEATSNLNGKRNEKLNKKITLFQFDFKMELLLEYFHLAIN